MDKEKMALILSAAVEKKQIDSSMKSCVLNNKRKLSPYTAAKIEIGNDVGSLHLLTKNIDFYQYIMICPFINMTWIIKNVDLHRTNIYKRMNGRKDYEGGLTIPWLREFLIRCSDRITPEVKEEIEGYIERTIKERIIPSGISLEKLGLIGKKVSEEK